MGTNLSISLVVAVAENGVIGNNGVLPWRLPKDLRRFKQFTVGQTVIAGRKTHESIIKYLGHPLPDRRTIIVTRARDYVADGCIVAHSPEEALEVACVQEVFVIGGAELYAAFLPKTSKIYRTLVHASPDGDTLFSDKFKPEEWKIFNLDYHPKDDRHAHAFSYELLVRR